MLFDARTVFFVRLSIGHIHLDIRSLPSSRFRWGYCTLGLILHILLCYIYHVVLIDHFNAEILVCTLRHTSTFIPVETSIPASAYNILCGLRVSSP